MPANDGRGYVLRRLIRRAFRHGNLLGLEDPFVFRLVGTVSDLVGGAYPELRSALPLITKVCRSEEERFSQTLSSGIRYFHQYVGEVRSRGEASLPGDVVFKLYDTFGFPLDLVADMARDMHFEIDEEGYRKSMQEQRDKARAAWAGSGARHMRVSLPPLRCSRYGKGQKGWG